MRVPSILRITTLFIAGTLLYSTPAHSWHIEYSVFGDLPYEDNGISNGGNITNLQVSGDIEHEVSAYWEITGEDVNPDGSIDVYYDIDEGVNDVNGLAADINFRIVSDYGNMDIVAIDSILNGFVDAESILDDQDPNSTLDKWSWTGAEIIHDADLLTAGVRDLAVDSMDNETNSDSFDDLPITLFANTQYSLFSNIGFDISAMLMMGLPEWFADQDDYDDFVSANGTEASATAYGRAGMFWEISIDGTETPVPEPSTMLLLGLGIIGLAGSRVTRIK